MYTIIFRPEIVKILDKLSKLDKATYARVLDKINQITNCSDVNHYKNLKYESKDHKRVHIGHFVLIFSVSGTEITFVYFGHHDEAYERPH